MKKYTNRILYDYTSLVCARSIYIRKMSERERYNQSNNNSTHGKANQKYEPRGEHRIDIERSAHADFRVMRCFCGCTALTYEEIEHFAMMNVSTLIVNTSGKTLFRNFLRIGHRHDKSEALVHLECFEMCDKFIRNINLIIDQDSIDDLYSSCPSFLWEQRITDAIQKSTPDHRSHNTRQVLNELKRECVHNIESHNDYDRFRRELLRKIGKSL